MNIESEDIESLLATPTRLRATAAALAMVMTGERPSLSRVAELSRVTRQALHKDHQPVVKLVAKLRAEWTPEVDLGTSGLQKKHDALAAELRSERQKRVEAERQRDRALHHLELSDATIRALQSKEASSGLNIVATPG